MRERVRRLRVIIPLLVFAWFAPSPSVAWAQSLLTNGSFSADGGGWYNTTSTGCFAGIPSMGGWQEHALAFSYITNSVTQTIVVSKPSTLTLTFNAKNRGETYINGRLTASLSASSDYATTGQFVPERIATPYSLTVKTVEPDEVVTVTFTGDDGGLFWAGCYGPTVTDALLEATPLREALPSNAMWAEIYENSSQVVVAPEGSVFSGVYFASYGTPEGYNGVYDYGWCHASQTLDIISAEVVGKQIATLVASNSVFGDPCGGTYKRLYVTLLYSDAPPVETTTPETTTTVEQTTPSTSVSESTSTTNMPATTIPVTETTITETTTSVPEVTVPQSTLPETTVPKPATVPENETQTSTTVTTITADSTSTTIPVVVSKEMTTEQVVEVLTDPNTLNSLSKEELETVFENLDVEELSEEEVVLLVNTLSNAPAEVKKAFESKINIFDNEKFGNYIPQNSVISVNQRRVIIVVSTMMATLSTGMTNPQRRNGR